MKHKIWKCSGCNGLNPCLLVMKNGEGRPSKCPYNLDDFNDDKIKWHEGKIEDLEIKTEVTL